MESPNITPNEPSESKTVSVPVKSKLGIIGLVLGVVGFIVSCCSLLFIYFLMGAAGGLDIMGGDHFVMLPFILYGGFFLGITGGIFGAKSLGHRENKLASGISVILGILMLVICIVLTFWLSVFYILVSIPI